MEARGFSPTISTVISVGFSPGRLPRPIFSASSSAAEAIALLLSRATEPPTPFRETVRRFQNAYHASSGRRLAIDRGRPKNSLHQQPLESPSRIRYFDRMKIVEYLERNGQSAERLHVMGPARTSEFRGLYSTQWTSRIPCNSHITKDRGTVYSSQNREGRNHQNPTEMRRARRNEDTDRCPR